MIPILVLYFFLLGLVIGSFLNVVILRHNTGRTTRGRSGCMTCGHQLSWKELVPVFSFLLQRGKCAHCRTKISWQYPAVEFSTAALFAFNFYFIYGNVSSLAELLVSVGLTSCIWALMVVMFVYDLRHKIIPDIFSLSAFALSIVYVLATTFVFRNNLYVIRGLEDSYLITLGGGIVFYLIVYLMWKLSQGRIIGLGDAKLLLSIGTILGVVYGFSAIALSSWFGILYVVYVLLKRRLSGHGKRITMRAEIPFGPFLILGFLAVYFLRIDVTNLSFLLENL